VPHAAPAPFVEVAAAIIEENGRYLIARRRGDAPLGGLWEFPGGKRMPHESIETCLVREVREEIGTDVAIIARFDRVVQTYPHATVEVHFFRCRLAHGQPRAIGCEDLRWVPATELAGYLFPEANAGVITRLTTAS